MLPLLRPHDAEAFSAPLRVCVVLILQVLCVELSCHAVLQRRRNAEMSGREEERKFGTPKKRSRMSDIVRKVTGRSSEVLFGF